MVFLLLFVSILLCFGNIIDLCYLSTICFENVVKLSCLKTGIFLQYRFQGTQKWLIINAVICVICEDMYSDDK